MPTPEQLVERAAYNYGDYYLLINQGYLPVPYQQEILCPALQSVEEGNCDRLIIEMAPGHSKTELCTAGFSPWVIGRRPDRRILLMSYGNGPAAEFGQIVRERLENADHQLVFPGCHVRKDSRAKTLFRTDEGGRIYAAGWRGALARIRADMILIDDPIKNYEDATSDRIMEANMRIFNSVVKDRLLPGGRIIICTNRWAPRDLVGRILEKERADWKVITLKAEPNPGSAQAGLLAPGCKYLWEEHFGRKRYEDNKRDQWKWETTWQQAPENALPQRFEQEWLQWRQDKIQPGRYRTCMIVDPALSKGKHADRTSIMVLAGGETFVNQHGQTFGRIHVVDWILDRINPDERTRAICKLADYWECDFILYEEVGMSSDTFYLNRDTELYGLNCPIIPVGRRGHRHNLSKDERIVELINDFQVGRVVFPDRMPYKQRNGEVVDLVDYFVKEEYLPWAGKGSLPHDEGLDTLSRMHDDEFQLEFEAAPPKFGYEEGEGPREGGQFAGRVINNAGASWFSR